VWGVALLGLVACAGFGVRAAGNRASAAPPAPQSSAPVQTSPQGASGSQTAQPAGTRVGATPPQTTPSGRGAGPSYGSPWEWWEDEAVKKELGLRPNQAADIDHIYARRVKDMGPVVQALVQEKAVLVKMIADRVVDDTQLDLELTKYDAMRLKLEASRTLMLYRISKVLDADQFAKLQAISDRHEALQAGRRGRGGAPAPRPLGLPR
jgi:hypothetical protein